MSKDKPSPWEINAAICRAFGIDPTLVFELDLSLRADALPTIVVKKHVRELPGAIDAKSFKLVPAFPVMDVTSFSDESRKYAKTDGGPVPPGVYRVGEQE